MLGKHTLAQLSHLTQLSISTLQRQFDCFEITPCFPKPPDVPVNLIVDATFFSRYDGVLVFRAASKNLYWQFIRSETI
ncbi:MAG: hypothetical protein AAGA27_08710 [Pseudomonadota bacterium]